MIVLILRVNSHDSPQLNYIHRYAGALLVIASNVHSLGYSEFEKGVVVQR